jgi:hypothetical protein
MAPTPPREFEARSLLGPPLSYTGQMRTDKYTKAVLTVIAIMLTLIACKQFVATESVARAEGPFAHLQFTSGNGYYALFDTVTGEIRGYPTESGELFENARLTKFGDPLTVACWNRPNCRGK